MVDDAYEQLLTAVSKGNLERVQLLLSDGFDVNIGLGRKSETFLHIAAHVEIINELVLRGADVNATNLSGETPLLRAVVDGKGLLVVKALLSAKADFNRKYYGSTLLHFSSDVDVTRELILHGIDVNVRNLEGRTPLHYAVVSPGALPRVKLLLKHGAEVDAMDNDGETPLYGVMCAVGAKMYDCKLYSIDYNSERDLEVVRELLEYGADINHQANDDIYSSPLGIAFAHEHLPLIQLLIRLRLFVHFNEDYFNIINLEPFIGEIVFFKAVSYIEECVLEIVKLKCDIVNNNQSLYDFVSFKKSQKIRPLYSTDKVLEESISKNYPIYHDIVFSRLKLCLEKANLLLKLRSLPIYSVKEGHGEVILIPDCISKIGEYLSKDDLLNFMKAFSKNTL